MIIATPATAKRNPASASVKRHLEAPMIAPPALMATTDIPSVNLASVLLTAPCKKTRTISLKYGQTTLMEVLSK